MITQTGTESELIYRQQAIDALDGELTITGRTNAEAVRGYVRLVKDRLERLPSATDTNVGIKLGTNLAEVGTDCISRQAAIDALFSLRYTPGEWVVTGLSMCVDALSNVPSAQPEIIYCKDCKHRDPEDRKCDCGMQWCAFPKEDDDFCSFAERREDG